MGKSLVNGAAPAGGMETEKVAELEKKLRIKHRVAQIHGKCAKPVIQRMPKSHSRVRKINLPLDVLANVKWISRIADHFSDHLAHDELRWRVAPREIALSIQGNQPLSANRWRKILCTRVDGAAARTRIRGGVEIRSRKTIPGGRGLGGESSDPRRTAGLSAAYEERNWRRRD